MATVEEMLASIATTGKNKMERHVPFLRLILRSDDMGDGWRNVTASLMLLTRAHVIGLGKAVEFFEQADGTGRIRITPFGHELLEFA